MIRYGLAVLASVVSAGPARAQVLGSDAAACRPGEGPAIAVEITGLKDRTGALKLELYPGDEADFLKDDRDLIAAGKTFRRVVVPTPASGPATMCIRVPRPGRYALLLTHNRDGKNKFSVWSDGAGFASNVKLGRSRPKVEQALVEVGAGVTSVQIAAQYLRGLGGFGPVTP
ncbi:DUF2141 domain-containing protein [Sphingomonas sp. Leaf38]|jgi:uncharacterized protein (DUF2141 family)|uniref:DUF2141 domain-containing protein n=1 Tax=Sphingomonas sp. Leaf38 TaxID=1736217 RepID=UPI0006F8CA6F|nr:DUF2141 domain-containing protein [Sphingomonas sp. Leaf38]KQN35375.1 hypothetical protein ASE88_17495 [Sphingomonas sp. Leaf38]